MREDLTAHWWTLHSQPWYVTQWDCILWDCHIHNEQTCKLARSHAFFCENVSLIYVSSQNLACSYFWLMLLRRKRQHIMNKIKKNAMRQLMAISKKDFTDIWKLEEMLGEVCEKGLHWSGLRYHYAEQVIIFFLLMTSRWIYA